MGKLAPVLLLAFVLAFCLMLLAACSSLKVEGECTYSRTVETRYECQPGGKLDHDRLAPGSVPE